MGSEQSSTAGEQDRLEREQEMHRIALERVREIRLFHAEQEARLEREEEIRRLARERQRQQRLLYAQQEARRRELERQEEEQLQEALRRSCIETQSQLYPNLGNAAGLSRYNTNQTTAASTSNFDQFDQPRPQPSARSEIRNRQPQATTSKDHAPNKKKIFTREDDSMLCKTCKKPYGADRIFQCKNGHSCCESCWTLSSPCGLCNGPITNVRNFDLETYVTANRRLKCPNAAEGCILTFKNVEIPKHVKECPFKELKCPAVENCNWIGKISQLSRHFDEDHPSSRQAHVDTEMMLSNICHDYNSRQLIKLGTFNFLFCLNVSEIEGKIYMAVQLIGTKATASKWSYEIHVYNKRDPRRKYQYVDRCYPLQETIALSECAVLPLPYVTSFVNEGSLTYKFFIKKNLKDN